MKSTGFLVTFTSLFLAGTTIAAAAPEVVASIMPVHSLVAAVMEGVGEPTLIVEGGASPHTYALKPSRAAALEEADVVFWIGPGLETFLEGTIATLAPDANAVALLDALGLTKLGLREGGTFEAHRHEGEHGHDHKHEDGHEPGHEHNHDHDHAHESDADGHEHEEEASDTHIWLDPKNAQAMVRAIEGALSDADPENSPTYQSNAAALETKLKSLTREVDEMIAPVQDRSFIVFHDAYRYFENRFGLQAAGSITVSPEVAPGAARVSEIRDTISKAEAACVFAEPQFEPSIVSVVTEGTEAQSGVLDPLGATLEDGPDLYFDLIRGMGHSFRDCLSEGR